MKLSKRSLIAAAILLGVVLLCAACGVEKEKWAVASCDVRLRDAQNNELFYVEKGTFLIAKEEYNETRRWVILPNEDGTDLEGHVLSGGLIDCQPLEQPKQTKVFGAAPVQNVNGYVVDTIAFYTEVTVLATLTADSEYIVVLYPKDNGNGNVENAVGIISANMLEPG